MSALASTLFVIACLVPDCGGSGAHGGENDFVISFPSLEEEQAQSHALQQTWSEPAVFHPPVVQTVTERQHSAPGTTEESEAGNQFETPEPEEIPLSEEGRVLESEPTLQTTTLEGETDDSAENLDVPPEEEAAEKLYEDPDSPEEEPAKLAENLEPFQDLPETVDELTEALENPEDLITALKLSDQFNEAPYEPEEFNEVSKGAEVFNQVPVEADDFADLLKQLALDGDEVDPFSAEYGPYSADVAGTQPEADERVEEATQTRPEASPADFEAPADETDTTDLEGDGMYPLFRDYPEEAEAVKHQEVVGSALREVDDYAKAFLNEAPADLLEALEVGAQAERDEKRHAEEVLGPEGGGDHADDHGDAGNSSSADADREEPKDVRTTAGVEQVATAEGGETDGDVTVVRVPEGALEHQDSEDRLVADDSTSWAGNLEDALRFLAHISRTHEFLAASGSPASYDLEDRGPREEDRDRSGAFEDEGSPEYDREEPIDSFQAQGLRSEVSRGSKQAQNAEGMGSGWSIAEEAYEPTTAAVTREGGRYMAPRSVPASETTMRGQSGSAPAEDGESSSPQVQRRSLVSKRRTARKVVALLAAALSVVAGAAGYYYAKARRRND
ncbi:hypothetical protein BESB_015130 [Besnoitia besnoiti]|uniref:Transmembrane protein n=1 Tax=Besnoitia besnoiti TaxID=94643 RepID=A0A2A9MBX8_BESBE|nr:hypothetical protein BESB_015130 [Besnoitia besnoiti]PFH32900.1 hypothetical protein BESB_015130 [Besnoitia besnoiti]